MIVRSRNINGVLMSEVQTEAGSINILESATQSIVDRVTPGLAIKYVEYGREDYQLAENNLSLAKGRFSEVIYDVNKDYISVVLSNYEDENQLSFLVRELLNPLVQ